MFLHIGNSKIVFNHELIGIFNIDPLAGTVNNNFLETACCDALNILYGHDQPKSFIVTRNEVYMSPISPLTLSKRHASFR